MKVPLFLSTCIVCPKCGSMIEHLPPGMEEAISNGDALECWNCQTLLIIKIEATQQLRAADGAVLSPDEKASINKYIEENNW